MGAVTDRGKYFALAVLLLPSLAGMFAFIMLPVLSSLVLSFSEWDLIGEIQWVGLGNYATILGDPAVHAALGNTLFFIAFYLPGVAGIALALALLLNRRLGGKVFFRAVYFVPVVTSWVAVSLIWKWLLNPQYGLVNYGLALIGIKGPGWPFDPAWAMAGPSTTSTRIRASGPTSRCRYSTRTAALASTSLPTPIPGSISAAPATPG